MKCIATASLLSVMLGFTTACSTPGDFIVTFYGYPDNSPPGPGTAYNCGGRNYVAGGLEKSTYLQAALTDFRI